MNTKAIILAAGQGTRLRPYTLDRPKCLVEIDGTSLLERQLAVLSAENIRQVVLIGGYRADMLELPETHRRVNARYAQTNMVWTLFCAEPDIDGDLVVSYGDIVYSRHILRELLRSRADIAVIVDLDWEDYWRARHGNPLDDAETLRLHSDGRILEIGRTPDSLDEIEGQYIGLMRFSAAGAVVLKKVFQEAKKAGKLNGTPPEAAYMTDMLQAIIDSGVRVDSVPVRGDWVEVDTVSDLTAEITKSRLAAIGRLAVVD